MHKHSIRIYEQLIVIPIRYELMRVKQRNTIVYFNYKCLKTSEISLMFQELSLMFEDIRDNTVSTDLYVERERERETYQQT